MSKLRMRGTPALYLEGARAYVAEAQLYEQRAAKARANAVRCLSRGLKRPVRDFDPNDINFCVCGRYAEQLDSGGDMWLCSKCIEKMRKEKA